jgi:MYXO-CTERM domain-containing protein
MKRAIWAVAVASFLVAGRAAADLPPDDPVCSGKQTGAECPGGACERTTCTRSRPDPGGGPPITSTVSCMRCTPGAKPTAQNAQKKSGCSAGVDANAAQAAFPAIAALAALAFVRRRRR